MIIIVKVKEDLTGRKFGRLTVIEQVEDHISLSGSHYPNWKCQCDCGTVCERTANQLTLNTMISCGCKTKEAQHLGFLKHGMKGTRLYRIWKAMKTRCYNPNSPYFKYYGGKGITVCDEWRDSFQAFYEWSMANGYSDELTIDRIDSDKGYFPANCRWVTMTIQNQNKKKVSVLV